MRTRKIHKQGKAGIPTDSVISKKLMNRSGIDGCGVYLIYIETAR